MSKAKQERAVWLREKAKEFLSDRGVFFLKMTGHHLKIGSVNYYPATGSIYFDGGNQARPYKGLNALFSVIQKKEPLYIQKPSEDAGGVIHLDTNENTDPD